MSAMEELLARTRSLTRFLQSQPSDISLSDLADALQAALESEIAIISRTGKVLAASGIEALSIESVIDDETSHLLRRLSEATTLDHITYTVSTETGPVTNTAPHLTVYPVYGGGKRLGTLMIGRELEMAGQVVAEYAAMVVGMTIVHAAEEESRREEVARMAVNSLSYSEHEAIRLLLGELEGREGLVTASKIADNAGFTRSVVVNALRKLESAGVVESRSLGMKGTHIKVLNEALLTSLNGVH